MVYEPLYHARVVATTNCFLVEKEISKAYQYYLIVFDKTIIPPALVGYEMIIANSALRALLAIYHLISNAHSWNNIKIVEYSPIPIGVTFTPVVGFELKFVRIDILVKSIFS